MPVTAADLPALLRDRAHWLSDRGARTEVLAEVARRRGLLGLGGRTLFRERTRVWRLGVVLLDAEGRLYATGTVTRAAPPRQHGYTSLSAEERSAARAVAAETFEPGVVVDYDAEELALDRSSLEAGSGPLRLVDGVVRVQWAPGQGYTDLDRYLTERAELLSPPPDGAA